jgi:hypothetical protein
MSSRTWSLAAMTVALVAGSVVLNVVSTSLFHHVDARAPAASGSLSPAVSTMWVALALAAVAGAVAVGLAIAGIRGMVRGDSDAFPMFVAVACGLVPLAAAAILADILLATDQHIQQLMA